MERINMQADRRFDLGTHPSRRLRRSGRVPAILYGEGLKEAISLSLGTKELEKALHLSSGGNVLVDLSVGGDEAKTRTVMFKSIARHPLSGNIEHVDLLEIQMDHKITVEVPIHITGKAQGIALGGILSHETRKVRIECLPAQIPASIDIDVTPLGITQSFHVSDIRLAEGIKILDDPRLTIVSIVAPTIEVAPKTAEEVEAELAESFKEEEKEESKESKETKKEG